MDSFVVNNDDDNIPTEVWTQCYNDRIISEQVKFIAAATERNLALQNLRLQRKRKSEKQEFLRKKLRKKNKTETSIDMDKENKENRQLPRLNRLQQGTKPTTSTGDEVSMSQTIIELSSDEDSADDCGSQNKQQLTTTTALTHSQASPKKAGRKVPDAKKKTKSTKPNDVIIELSDTESVQSQLNQASVKEVRPKFKRIVTAIESSDVETSNQQLKKKSKPATCDEKTGTAAASQKDEPVDENKKSKSSKSGKLTGEITDGEKLIQLPSKKSSSKAQSMADSGKLREKPENESTEDSASDPLSTKQVLSPLISSISTEPAKPEEIIEDEEVIAPSQPSQPVTIRSKKDRCSTSKSNEHVTPHAGHEEVSENVNDTNDLAQKWQSTPAKDKEKLLEKRREFEQAIESYEGDDPLEQWYQYIGWVKQNYPIAEKISALYELYAQCVPLFEKDKRYLQDQRMLKLNIKCISVTLNYILLENDLLRPHTSRRGAQDTVEQSSYNSDSLNNLNIAGASSSESRTSASPSTLHRNVFDITADDYDPIYNLILPKTPTTLALSANPLQHNSVLRSTETTSSSTADAATSANAASINEVIEVDSDSSVNEFEDASDFNGDDDIFIAPPTSRRAKDLIPDGTDNERLGCMQFIANYKERYGEPYPQFFEGSLEEALNEACHKPAKDRKLLAIYLHHDKRVLTNVFCDRLMKCDALIQTLEHNFILYGWDLTNESNKNLLLSSLSACASALTTIRDMPTEQLPSILIIGKSQSVCEVLSVIYGNVGVDELLNKLMDTIKLYSDQRDGHKFKRPATPSRKKISPKKWMAVAQADSKQRKIEAFFTPKSSVWQPKVRLIRLEEPDDGPMKPTISSSTQQSKPSKSSPKTCTHCDKRCSSPSALVAHIRTHTGEKPYPCTHCDMRFAVRCTLKDHIRTHTSEKPYPCTHCDMRFAVRCTLKDHIRTHTGEKPYLCTHCDMRFAVQSGLADHVALHMGNDPFECPQCHLGFPDRENFDQHIRKHSGRLSFECQNCHEKFDMKQELATHTMRKHIKGYVPAYIPSKVTTYGNDVKVEANKILAAYLQQNPFEKQAYIYDILISGRLVYTGIQGFAKKTIKARKNSRLRSHLKDAYILKNDPIKYNNPDKKQITLDTIVSDEYLGKGKKLEVRISKDMPYIKGKIMEAIRILHRRPPGNVKLEALPTQLCRAFTMNHLNALMVEFDQEMETRTKISIPLNSKPLVVHN